MANLTKPGLHDYHAIVFILDGSIDEHSDYVLVKLAPKHITIKILKKTKCHNQTIFLFVVALLG